MRSSACSTSEILELNKLPKSTLLMKRKKKEERIDVTEEIVKRKARKREQELNLRNKLKCRDVITKYNKEKPVR